MPIQTLLSCFLKNKTHVESSHACLFLFHQACIKPVEASKPEPGRGAGGGDEDGVIQINTNKAWKSRNTKRESDSGNQSTAAATSSKTSPLSVTLGDCLACSGCITSAEAVLIAEQSHDKVLEILDSKPVSVAVVVARPNRVLSVHRAPI